MANFRLKKKSERKRKKSEINLKKGNTTFLPPLLSEENTHTKDGVVYKRSVSSLFNSKIEGS